MRCRVDVAPLRAEPDEGAEQVTQALRGEPLFLEEHRGDWARVVTAYGYPGWVRGEALEEGPGELPEPAAGSPLDVARSYLGAPYLWGGLTEAGIDCSGLVHMAYRRLGRLVPRDADQQARAGLEVASSSRVISSPTASRPITSLSGSAAAGFCTRRAARTESASSRRTSGVICARGATG